MENKIILITGASGGMGKELTEYFNRQNCKLVLHYHRNSIQTGNSESVMTVQADLTDEQQVKGMIDAIIERFGRIDVVINNAGISRSSISWKTELEAWKETMAINLDAPFLVSKAVSPIMRDQRSGRIINITSIVAQTGMIGTAAYAASKAGLIGLTKTMSKELASSNVTVNALALGYFNTGMIRDVPQELQEKIIESIPMKQLGDPITVCKTIAWLISKESSYVTGQVINLNGGMYS
jgi:NAD(P)-dependent dehydrogenase (short-subunit alcohol dehydrogenase family)